jgi:hypothetical protein
MCRVWMRPCFTTTLAYWGLSLANLILVSGAAWTDRVAMRLFILSSASTKEASASQKKLPLHAKNQ